MTNQPALNSIEARFAFGREIGRGSFGQVLEGTDRLTGERVAIKRIVARGEDPAELDRFLQESRLLAQVRSPHVVRYIADGTDDAGCPCIVLEWLEGESLTARQRRAPIDLRNACEIARQIAVGLDAIHRLAIVHRDIKPSNVSIETKPDGQLHVTIFDLGAARVTFDPSITLAGTLVGTPAYMAPEQAREETVLTPQVDVFALGAVLFELLTRRRAFDGPPHVVLTQILLGEIPDVLKFAPEVPASVAAIVQRALARSPTDRWPSALAMADALHSALVEEATSTSPSVTTAPAASSAVAESAKPASTKRPLGLGTAERRVVCALFANFGHSSQAAMQIDEFRKEAAARNTEAVTMMGGWCVTLFGLRKGFGDAVLKASQMAVHLKDSLQHGSYALVTCRIAVTSDAIPTDAIERAVSLLAKPVDGIAVDEVSASLLGAHVAIKVVDGLQFIQGEQIALHHGPPKLLGIRTPIVGRENELALLNNTLRQCIDRRAAKGVLVLAPPGRGKSRLRWEWTQRLKDSSSPVQNAMVLTAQADPMGRGVALGLVGQLVRDAMGIQHIDDPSRRREKLSARLIERVSPNDCLRITTFLGELVGAPFDDSLSRPLQAARANRLLMADQTKRAWEDWLRIELAERAVLIVLEDLQWADAPSLGMIEAALDLFSDRALMVAAFARPEIHETFPTLFARTPVLEVPLSELKRKDAEQLVRGTLANASEQTIQHLVECADGNAFVLEELIRGAASGTLTSVPQSALAVAETRLQQLSPQARRVLRLASVLGSEFWPNAVESLLGPAQRATLTDALNTLEHTELIVRRADTRFAGEIQYGFRHALLHDAAYAMLTQEDLEQAHHLAGEWLALAGEPDSVRIASHFASGNRLDRAAEYFVKAATTAMERCDLEAVVLYTKRAVECGISDQAALGELWMLRAEALRAQGQNPDGLAAAKEALALLPPTSEAWFRAITLCLHAATRLADRPSLLEAAKLLLQQKSRRFSATEAEAHAHGILSLTYHGYTDLVDALAARLDSAEPTSRSLWDGRTCAAIAGARRMRTHSTARLDTAIAALYQAATLLEEAGDLRGLAPQLGNLGYGYSQIGDFDRSEQLLRRAIVESQRIGLADVEANSRANLTLLYSYQGRATEAEREGQQAIASFQKQTNRTMVSHTLIHIANAMLAEGRLDSARAYAQQGFDVAANPSLRAAALATQSRIERSTNSPQQALELAQQAMAILDLVRSIEDFDFVIWLAFVEALFACEKIIEAEDALRTVRPLIQARLVALGDETVRQAAATHLPELRALLGLCETYLRDTEHS